MKTVEELLIRRYKVIAPYPFSPYKVGDIICPKPDEKYFTAIETSEVVFSKPITTMKDMPNIFQPLPWWSDREVEDMPQYVKLKNMKDEIEVHEVGQWNERNGMPFVEGFGTMIVREMTPATREEYELFKQRPLP